MTVDVVKVPHHGSENNVVETTLLDRVIAKHYVFCGDGHSGNPEIDVVELMAKQRLKAPGKFKFWFNSSEAVLTGPETGAITCARWRKRSHARQEQRRTHDVQVPRESGSSLRVT